MHVLINPQTLETRLTKILRKRVTANFAQWPTPHSGVIFFDRVRWGLGKGSVLFSFPAVHSGEEVYPNAASSAAFALF